MVTQRTSLGTSWILIIVFVLLAGSIGTAGYFFYLDQKNGIKDEKQRELLSVAELKSRTIARWRGDRFDDSRVIYNNPLLSTLIHRWLKAGAPSGSAKQDLLLWMSARQQYYHYNHIVLFNLQGKPLLSVPQTSPFPVTRLEREWVSTAVTTRQPVFSDIYRDPSSGKICTEIFIPLAELKDHGGRIMAVVMIQENPERGLFPLVQSWPTMSPSAECLLVRRDGDKVLVLNEPRHLADSALMLEYSASDQGLVSAKVAQGEEGIIEGLDYRGIPVIAAVKRISNSPWYLIAKIDADEVYVPIRERARFLAGTTIVMVLVAGAGAFLFWRQTQFRFYRERFDADQQLLALAQRFESFTRHANDAILLMDEEGKILEANDRAVSWYGYSREEFLCLSLCALRAPETLHLVDTQLELAWSLEGVVYETVHQRKNGICFPVEISSRVVRIGGTWYYQSIVRDISERKAAERQLQQKQLELECLNKTLEERVREEVARNREKDHLLIQQSRLAAMGEMIGNIAHQWRQPLNVVGLLFQTLPEYYRNGELTEESLEETIGQAMDVITYMSRTINDFRNFFKPEKEKKTFFLRETIDQALSFLQPHFHYHNIEISLSIACELRTVGYANEYSQVLINILGNAKDVFLERRVANPKVTITAFEQEGKSVVIIEDNGGGVHEPVIDRVFEPYFTSKQGGEGTGLGLYMSKIIIEKNMQGSLSVRNTESGAEFRIVV